MKKKSLLILSALLLSTTILAGCNIRFGITSRDYKNGGSDNNSSNNSTGLYKADFHETMPIDDVTKLDISMVASEVIIKAIDGNNLTLDCTGSSNIVKETILNKNRNTLYIEEKGLNSFDYSAFSGNNIRKVVIGIPTSFNGSAIISCGAGTVNISDTNFTSLDLDGGMGELIISNISFDELTLNQGIGETNISLDNKCGDMDISGGMGEFYLSLKEVGGNLTYSGGIGETIIDIPDNSPVKFLTDTGLGSTNIYVSTSGENTYTFDLSVGIGSLTVK